MIQTKERALKVNVELAEPGVRRIVVTADNDTEMRQAHLLSPGSRRKFTTWIRFRGWS